MGSENEVSSLVQPQESKQQQVYRQIRDAILHDEFPPGTIMVERKLCDIYGVSRSPIRNALQQLTFEGVLAYQPGKGTVVPEFTLEDILEIYDLLEIHQLYAVRQCIGHLDVVAEETLRQIIQNMRECLDKGDLYSTSDWDHRLHDFIAMRSGNHRLHNIFGQVHNQQVRFVARTLSDREHYELSYDEHREICACILARDVPGAELAVRRHYANLRQYYISHLISKDYLA